MANSVDPDQSGSALFAHACLSQNLGFLQYLKEHFTLCM